MFAVGICAGGGYMARAVAAQPLFCAFAGVADTDAQATEQSINSAAPAIARAYEAEKRWRETGVEETVPAVAADNGDVAMPLAEAFAYYGTPRGAVPNYINGFAVQSWAYTSTFDAIGAAKPSRCRRLSFTPREPWRHRWRDVSRPISTMRVFSGSCPPARSISMTILGSLRSGRMRLPDFSTAAARQ